MTLLNIKWCLKPRFASCQFFGCLTENLCQRNEKIPLSRSLGLNWVIERRKICFQYVIQLMLPEEQFIRKWHWQKLFPSVWNEFSFWTESHVAKRFPGTWSVCTTGKKFKRRLDYSIEYLPRQKMLDIKGLFDVSDKNIKEGNLSNTKSNKV